MLLTINILLPVPYFILLHVKAACFKEKIPAELQMSFNPLMPGGNKKVTHTLSMCDLFVTTRH